MAREGPDVQNQQVSQHAQVVGRRRRRGDSQGVGRVVSAHWDGSSGTLLTNLKLVSLSKFASFHLSLEIYFVVI